MNDDERPTEREKPEPFCPEIQRAIQQTYCSILERKYPGTRWSPVDASKPSEPGGIRRRLVTPADEGDESQTPR